MPEPQNKAEARAWMLYNRIHRLTGRDVGKNNDWIEITNTLCDFIAAQKKEIGRLEEKGGEG